jgi:tetratricopeptide (TPR) repeat protein
MMKSVFREGVLAIIAFTILLAFVTAPGALCQDKGLSAAYHNQRGTEFFKKGFYDHAPKDQAADADLSYGLAIKEFKAAIAKDASYTEAHRNLARVYHVQKNFEGAAEEYRKVTELAPDDVDAYVNLALALIELKRLDEAIQVLENGKEHTSDPKALNALDTYISKIRVHQAEEVR